LYPTDKLIIDTKDDLGKPYLLTGNNETNKTNVIAVCGIAKPQRFYNMLTAGGYQIIHNLTYDDHHKYVAKDISHIISICEKMNCNTIATTEKDAVKLNEFVNEFTKANISVLVYPLHLSIIDSDLTAFTHKILTSITHL
jgi:tetraacyldisaccharide-1-P 4'-kinase